MANGLKRIAFVGLMALGTWPFFGCQEEITTVVQGDLIPVGAVTVEVVLPFEEFGSDPEAWGGYGQPYELSTPIIARAFEEILDSRIVNAWHSYPIAASVRDSTRSSV